MSRSKRRPQNLVQRIRTHLVDDRINSPQEADAEMELMTNAELVEVISFCLEDMMAGRRTKGLRRQRLIVPKDDPAHPTPR